MCQILNSRSYCYLLRSAANFVSATGYEVAFEVARDFKGKYYLSDLATGTSDHVYIYKTQQIAEDTFREGNIPDAIVLINLHFHPGAHPYPKPSAQDLLHIEHRTLLEYHLDDVRPICGISTVDKCDMVTTLFFQKRHAKLRHHFPGRSKEQYPLQREIYELSQIPLSSMQDTVSALRDSGLLEALCVEFRTKGRTKYFTNVQESDLERFSYVPRLSIRRHNT